MGTAEVLTDAGNWAVVQLPGRRFPGVVVQGDSLSIIVRELDLAGAALRRGDTVRAEEDLSGVLKRLTAAMAHYESTLVDRGINLPLPKRVDDAPGAVILGQAAVQPRHRARSFRCASLRQ